MNRRKFLVKTSLFAGSAGLMSFSNAFTAQKQSELKGFKLLYAPHFGMFKNSAGGDFVDQLKFMHEQGFRAMEDNGMKGRSLADQERIAKTMSDLNMKMGVFVAHTIDWKETTLASGNEEKRETFLREIAESVEVAKRVNAKWVTVVPGHLDLRLDIGFQTAHVVESLKRACEILEPHGIVMVLEPLNFYNHPGLFLTSVPQTFEICKAVNSPSCKILFDFYHQQIQTGNLIPNMDLAWDETAYFQVGDNPGRKEPTTGEINYRNVFKHIYEKGGTDIIVGMEHGNSISGKEGEEAVIKAYRDVDGF